MFQVKKQNKTNKLGSIVIATKNNLDSSLKNLMYSNGLTIEVYMAKHSGGFKSRNVQLLFLFKCLYQKLFELNELMIVLPK